MAVSWMNLGLAGLGCALATWTFIAHRTPLHDAWSSLSGQAIRNPERFREHIGPGATSLGDDEIARAWTYHAKAAGLHGLMWGMAYAVLAWVAVLAFVAIIRGPFAPASPFHAEPGIVLPMLAATLVLGLIAAARAMIAPRVGQRIAIALAAEDAPRGLQHPQA